MSEPLTKFCPDCGEERPAAEFYRFKKNGGYLFPRCKKHSNRRTAQYYRENPDKKRGANLRKNYKISAEEYDRLYRGQGGVCAACGRPETEVDSRTKLVKNLHVDHCHKTGVVRALLCGGCNSALGHLGDDPERIRLLLHYAEVYREGGGT